MMTSTQDLGDIAKEQAEQLENADSVRDADLRGEGILDVKYSVSRDGTIRGVEVVYNADIAKITVNLTDQSLTASMSGESHTTHIGSEGHAVLKDAEMWWLEMADGTEMKR